MKPDESRIIGTCLYMCPAKERLLREKEGLLHKFEWDTRPSTDAHDNDVGHLTKSFKAMEFQKQSYQSGSTSYGGSYVQSQKARNQKVTRQLPKADVNKTIKSFARSAAGQDKTVPEDLRPPSILEMTVTYLLHKVLTRTDEPFIVIYDFVFDRLRSVRQDLVIQRISDKTAIAILESVVRFHLYSGFRLRNEPAEMFDSHINQKHLMDCLRTLLGLYDMNQDQFHCESRKFFEALHILLQPNSLNVLSRALKLNLPKTEEILCAMKMSMAFQFKNYAKYFRLSKKLPPLLASCVAFHIRELRSNAYAAMSLAYGVRNCKVPLSFVTSILDYPDSSYTRSDLITCSIEILEEGTSYVKFDKNNSNAPRVRVDNLTRQFGDLNSGCNAMSPRVCEFKS